MLIIGREHFIIACSLYGFSLSCNVRKITDFANLEFLLFLYCNTGSIHNLYIYTFTFLRNTLEAVYIVQRKKIKTPQQNRIVLKYLLKMERWSELNLTQNKALVCPIFHGK